MIRLLAQTLAWGVLSAVVLGVLYWSTFVWAIIW